MAASVPVKLSSFQNLYPFRRNFLNIDGLQYHYVDEGIGEPIVMVHGNPTWSFYFRNLITSLSEQYRTIVPDHIGCGLSDKPTEAAYDFRLKSRIADLESLLAHLDVKDRITLILHDWGGAIGMAFALNNPQAVRRIVLLNTAAFFPPRGKGLPVRLWMIRNLAGFSKLAVLGLNLFAGSALYMASHKGLSEPVKNGLIAPYNCPRNRIATLKFVEDIPVRRTDLSYETIRHLDKNLDRLAHIPKLICWGMRDFVFDADYLAEWQRRFPDAEVHAFPDAGHYVLEDQPNEIRECIRNFLASHPI